MYGVRFKHRGTNSKENQKMARKGKIKIALSESEFQFLMEEMKRIREEGFVVLTPNPTIKQQWEYQMYMEKLQKVNGILEAMEKPLEEASRKRKEKEREFALNYYKELREKIEKESNILNKEERLERLDKMIAKLEAQGK